MDATDRWLNLMHLIFGYGSSRDGNQPGSTVGNDARDQETFRVEPEQEPGSSGHFSGGPQRNWWRVVCKLLKRREFQIRADFMNVADE